MAQDAPAIRKAQRALKPCHGQYGALADQGLIICVIGWRTEALSVKILRIHLRGAVKPGGATYIGSPPDEIAGIVNSTIAATTEMGTAERRLEKACTPGTTSSRCEFASFDWGSADSDITAALASWKPYGG